jgi:anti-anti-sigma factor
VFDEDGVLAISTNVDVSPAVVVLQVRGEIDMATAGDLDAAILAIESDGCRDVNVDLEEVTFIDSHGLRVLIEAQRTLARRDIQLLVTRPGSQARRLFEITGTADLLMHRAPTITP